MTRLDARGEVAADLCSNREECGPLARARRRPPRGLVAGLLSLPLLLLCCGGPALTPASSSDGNTPSTANDPLSKASTALRLAAGNDQKQFRGSLTSSGQVALFGLGMLSPGDHLIADIQRASGNLDPVAALFDSNDNIVAYNDDRSEDGSDLNPLIDIIMPNDTDDSGEYYLGIIAYPGDSSAGDYQATVTVQRQAGTLTPHAQTVYLDWRGGSNITVKNVGVYTLLPFSATQVGFPNDQSAALKSRVQAIVRERYTHFNMTVLSSDDGPPPATPHSTVYFGGRDAQAFAISEDIDTFNANPSDNSIVFTQGYLSAFVVQPTLEEMAQAIGNTVAHEIGHLLGLVHTADCQDLMDTTCYNERLLSAQQFGTAVLDTSIFPFGSQESPEILGWVLGLVSP